MQLCVRLESEAVMKSVVCGLLAVLGVCGGSPAWADDAFGQPALRLPGEPGATGWASAPQHALRLWASDLSDRLARIGRPHLPALRWRVDGADRARLHNADETVHLERSRTALTAHWQPVSVGAWKLGAAMGLSRAMPSAASGTTSFAAMPMASYERPNYRFNLGLVAPHGDRDPALVVGLTLPLR